MTTTTTRTFSESSSETNAFEGNIIVEKTAADDGAGKFTGVQSGVINYTTGVLTFKPTDAYKKTDWSRATSGGTDGQSSSAATEWKTVDETDTYAASLVRVTFRQDTGTPVDASDTIPARPFVVNLTPRNNEVIVPGSVAFNFAGLTYVDRNGNLVCNINKTTGAGVVAGLINYKTGQATIGLWNPGFDLSAGDLFQLLSLTTAYGEWTAERVFFRTAGSPIRPASLYVQATSENGDLITATADQSGIITGALARGTVQQDMGVVAVEFGELVTAAGNELEPWYSADAVVGGQIWRPINIIPSTVRYTCVVLSNLPLNADVLGLDPVRLPSDGRVPIFRPADVVVIHNTKSTTLANPAVAGATYSAGRTDLSDVWVLDATGAAVASTHYAADLAAGTITMAADLALGATPQPLVLRHRIEELNMLSDVQINGEISLTGALSRAYDGDTLVSSALLFGDMFARVTGVFDQLTWTGAWADALIGSQATGQYNTVDYPIEVVNAGAVTERWRLNFTTSTAYQLIGENLGVIATGTTADDLQPANSLTGQPYFTLRAAGWGAGWAAGNQLRFNTISATAPIWVARTVLPGATLAGDAFDLQLRGDVDA